MRPVDETAETLEEEYVDPMAPLQEEQDVAAYQSREVGSNDPTHRRLRAIAGAGNAYVFLTVSADDQVSLEFQGIAPENLSEVLNRVAEAVRT